LIVELDGWEFHKDRQAFEDDRERDAENLRVGVATMRMTRDRFDNSPAREAARLTQILNRLAPG
jgi:very-short-patch-repair endonuclease